MDPSVRPEWSSLAQRLQWVLHNRTGVVDDAEDWCKKAGVSRQYLWAAMNRPNSDIKLGHAAKLVDVPGLRIDLYWLATGRGEPAGGVKSSGTSDLLHERRRAAQKAMDEDGVPMAVIEEVRRDPAFNKPEHREKKMAYWHRVFLKVAFQRAQQAANERGLPDEERDAG